MKTEEEIKKEIEKLEAELNNVVNEYNFCMQKTQELRPRIQYLSGKIDALKELTVEKQEITKE